MFKRVLIANRGEVAVRIARACREVGASPVAVFSDVDRRALHVRVSDEAYAIGPAPSVQSYLNIDRVIEVAKKAKIDAIHPGYGFLSENHVFAQAVEDAGITWVGPSPRVIHQMGDKVRAREIAAKAGVPLVPGTKAPISSPEEAATLAREYGYPILLKAAAGGGGKGMRLVERESDIKAALQAATGEATRAFGNGAVYVEKYLREPRHIEFQVLGDPWGKVLHLYERECSIQRRHQKVVEETPAPTLPQHVREAMAEAAVRIAREVGYVSAGTIEFLYDAEGKFYFLEMNTRLQVEHPITEAVTGIDLVKAMLRIAAGEKIRFEQSDIVPRGHAMECRIYAEDPANGFMPSPGEITAYRVPGGPGVRVDGGVYAGYVVPSAYDPMISKLITFGFNRSATIRRMRRALAEYTIRGIKTTIPLFLKIMKDADFKKGNYSTHFLTEEFLRKQIVTNVDETKALIAAAVAVFERDSSVQVLPGAAAEAGADSQPWGYSRWRWAHHKTGFGRG